MIGHWLLLGYQLPYRYLTTITSLKNKFGGVKNFSYLYGMKSKTRLNTLTRKQLMKISKFALTYCQRTFGYNNRKRTTLDVKVMDEILFEPTTCGWYDPVSNEMVIAIKPCKYLGAFTASFIHEYTHYLQPCLTKYNKLLKEHGYSNHPFEIEAYKTEKIYNRRLLNELRKFLKRC